MTVKLKTGTLMVGASLALGAGVAVNGQEGFFADARPVPGLSTTDGANGPSVTEDGLLIFFFSRDARGAGGQDIWMAARFDGDDPFGPAVPVVELNTRFADTNPNISRDGLTIYFNSAGHGGAGEADLFVATRASRDEPFAEPSASPFVNLNTEMSEVDPNVSADGRTVYFCRAVADPNPQIGFTSFDLYVATRAGDGDRFDDVRPLAGINTEFSDSHPSVSRDGRTIFFSEWLPFHPGGPAGADAPDLWTATWNGTDFEKRTVLMPPSTVGWDSFPWISWDWPGKDSKLYFMRCPINCGGGRPGIYEATWIPDPVPEPEFLRGDCNGDGWVDLSDAVCILNWLFAGEKAPECAAATNTNGDEAASISDASYVLNFLFAGGPAPIDPFPDCGPGTLPVDEQLGCANPPNCQ